MESGKVDLALMAFMIFKTSSKFLDKLKELSYNEITIKPHGANMAKKIVLIASPDLFDGSNTRLGAGDPILSMTNPDGLTIENFKINREEIEDGAHILVDIHGNSDSTSSIVKDDANVTFADLINTILDSIYPKKASIHLISCHAGKSAEAIYETLVDSKYLNNAIFIHAGDEIIRGKKGFHIIDIVKTSVAEKHSGLQSNFDMFHKFFTDVPGGFSLIQMPSSADKQPLFLTNTFHFSKLYEINEIVQQDWQKCIQKINAFSEDNNTVLTVPSEANIDTFSYIANALGNGADACYNIVFPFKLVGQHFTLNMLSDSEENNHNINSFVQDLRNLVSRSLISENQYNELIGIEASFRLNVLSITPGAKIIFAPGSTPQILLGSAFNTLFQHPIDLAQLFSGDTQDENATYTTQRSLYDLIITPCNNFVQKQLLQMPGITCSNLDLDHYMTTIRQKIAQNPEIQDHELSAIYEHLTDGQDTYALGDIFPCEPALFE